MKLPPFPSKFVKATSPQIIQARVRTASSRFCHVMCSLQDRQRQLEQILNAALAVSAYIIRNRHIFQTFHFSGARGPRAPAEPHAFVFRRTTRLLSRTYNVKS
jgi:hypothetical protein